MFPSEEGFLSIFSFLFFIFKSEIVHKEGVFEVTVARGRQGSRVSCCVVPPPPVLLPLAASHQQRPAAAGITDDYLLQSNRLISKFSRAQRHYQAAASAAVHSGKLTACSTWQHAVSASHQ